MTTSYASPGEFVSEAQTWDAQTTDEIPGSQRDSVQILARAAIALRANLEAPASALIEPKNGEPARRSEPSGKPMPNLHPGDIVADRFQIARFIDRGGMGEVYEAEDLATRALAHVALKIIRPDIVENRAMVSRFEREIEIGRLVTHPNVCRTYDLGLHRAFNSFANPPVKFLFITMELLSGATLTNRLSALGPLAKSEALPLIRQLADALNAVHDAGIVHGDLKPDNIMLAPVENRLFPRVVLMDFGLARRFPRPERASDCEYAGGTPDYMSPEQVRGIAIGPSSDIYSLGLLIYRMMTGTLPFQGTNATSRMRRRLEDSPESPVKYAPDLGRRWESVVLKCLSVDPSERFSSAAEIAAALTADRKEAGASRDTFRYCRRRMPLRWLAVSRGR